MPRERIPHTAIEFDEERDNRFAVWLADGNVPIQTDGGIEPDLGRVHIFRAASQTVNLHFFTNDPAHFEEIGQAFLHEAYRLRKAARGG